MFPSHLLLHLFVCSRQSIQAAEYALPKLLVLLAGTNVFYSLIRSTNRCILVVECLVYTRFSTISKRLRLTWLQAVLKLLPRLLCILGRFAEELFVLQRAIRMGDGPALFDYFTRTRAIRRGIIEQGQETAAPDFGRQAASVDADQ